MSERIALWAEAARIDLLGQPLLTGLTLRTGADRVALLGDWSALFSLLSGEAQLASGELRVGDAPVPRAVEQGTVGLMRLDPILSGTLSAEALLATSAELCGIGRKDAQKLAFETLERLGLLSLSTRRVAHLERAERRALLVAHAALTNPRVLCLEQPLSGLDSHGEAAVLAVIERACASKQLLLGFGDAEHGPGARRLLETCGERIRLSAGVARAELANSAPAARVTATICRNHEAFARALTARGLAAHPTHEAGMLSVLTSASAGPCWRYLVELPGATTAPLLDAALETDAGLVELVPIP